MLPFFCYMSNTKCINVSALEHAIPVAKGVNKAAVSAAWPLPNELLNNSIRPSKHNSKPAEVCQQTQIMTSSRASFTGHLSQQRLRNGFFLFAHPTPYNTDANVCWMLWPRHCVCLHFPTRSFLRTIVYDTNKRDQRSPQCPVAFR